MSTKIDAPADDITLPAMPKPDAIGVWGYMEPTTHSDAQIQAYARAAVIADRASPSPSRADAVPTWPKNASEVRAFMDPHCEVVQYAIDVKTPAEGDRYQLTAHDFLSAINWWADYHATPAASPVPAAVDVGAAPDTVPLPRKEWEELDYWLGRCESKGHLERCSDLIEPYEALCKAIAASATQQGATP